MNMDGITLRAYAKINLSLQVTGRREDGYHNIRSLMQGIGLYDVIKITKCAENGTKYNLPHCTFDGIVVYLCSDVKTIPADMSNLALKGARTVLDRLAAPDRGTGPQILGELADGLIISISKRLPVAAGIAGGSGNAAAAMLGINAVLGNPLSLRELMDAGAAVGADVPFSLFMNARRNARVLEGLMGLEEAGTAAHIGGIGDIVIGAEPVCRYVILANPGIAVSTRDAYEAIDSIQADRGQEDVCRAAASDEDPEDWPLFVNDLESYTLRDYEEAARIKAVMQEELAADIVMMSGSGPTMVAYYRDRAQTERDFAVMQEIACREPGWKTWLTYTGYIEEQSDQ